MKKRVLERTAHSINSLASGKMSLHFADVILQFVFLTEMFVEIESFPVSLRLRLTASMRHGDGTLPEMLDTPTRVWRQGIYGGNRLGKVTSFLDSVPVNTERWFD